MKRDIKTWDDVDDAVRRMGEIDIRIGKIQGEATIRVNQIKDETKQLCAPLLAERKGLEKGVQAVCEERKADFAKKRSKILNFGTIGYRLVRSVAIPREKERVRALLQALKAFGLQQCVRTEEKPDRDAIVELDDATIAKLGLTRTVKDSFRVVPDMERIEETILN